jgi:hypothetical protein
VTIIGLGAENLFISGNKTYTVFVVTDVSATISGVTIESGFNLGDRGIWVGQGLPLLI